MCNSCLLRHLLWVATVAIMPLVAGCLANPEANDLNTDPPEAYRKAKSPIVVAYLHIGNRILDSRSIGDHFYRVLEETWYKYYYMKWTRDGYVTGGDGKMELDPEDDAAYVNWGSNWRTPTLEQLKELVAKCEWQWTRRDGVNGYLVTGRNGNSIFLPTAGGCSNHIYNDGEFAYYWSRTLCSAKKMAIEAADQGEAYILFFNSFGKQEIWYDSRYIGIPVRAVRASRK